MKPAGTTFTPSIWQRLTKPATAAVLTLDQHKRAITRDLENLLNTRTAIPEEELTGLPLQSAHIRPGVHSGRQEALSLLEGPPRSPESRQ